MASRAEATVTTHQLQLLHSHGFPLSAVISAISVGIAQAAGLADPVRAVNILTVIVSSLCLPIYFSFVKRCLGPAAGFFATFLFMISPIFLGNSVYGNTHPLGLFFILLGAYRILSYQARPSWTEAILSGLLVGLGGATRLQDMAALLFPLCLLFLTDKTTRACSLPVRPGIKIAHLTGFLGVTFLTVLLFYIPVLARDPHFSSPQHMSRFFTFEITSRFAGISLDYLPYTFFFLRANFSYLGLCAVVAGFILLFRQNPILGFVMLCWFLFPLFVFSSLDILSPRFLIIALPALYLSLGYLLSRLFQTHISTRLAAVILFSLLCTLSYQRIYPLLEFRHRHALLPEFYRWLGRHVEENAQIIISDGGAFLAVYGQRPQLRRPLKVRQPYSPEELAEFKDALDTRLQTQIPVYITGTGLYSHDPDGQFSNFINNNYRLRLVGRKPSEDWHRGAIYAATFFEHVYRIEKKEN